MERYNKIKETFKQNNCCLLTTFIEYKKLLEDKIEYNKRNNKKTSLENIRVIYTAQCGHENNVAISNFMARKTGLLCSSCKNTKIKKINLSKNTHYNLQEHIGNKILEKYIGDEFILKYTKEGCSADVLIKEKILNNNLYLPLQLKTTQKLSCNNTYTFKKITKSYKDMLIVCICIKEEKFWIIPFNEIREMKNLSISNKSKYNKYEVETHKLVEIFKTYSHLTIEYELVNIPKSKLQIREQYYLSKRENAINFFNYIKPHIQGTITDFIINGKNIQEKVVGYRKDRKSYNVWLSTSNGKKEKNKRNWRTYKLGENDFYWFHSSIDDRFWIIPEIILYNNDYISNINETKNRTNIYFKILENGDYQSNNWMKNYEYNYSNIDDIIKNKLIELFK
jgi:hypothetical protein